MEAEMMKEFFFNFKLDSRMKIMLLKWKLDWWKKSSSTSSCKSGFYFNQRHIIL